MTSQNWRDRSVSLSQLAVLAAPWSQDIGAFEFLHQIEVVPHEVKSMPAAKVKFNIDPEAIPIEYLASSAYEWDSWGPSHPEDFIDAIKAELNPIRRDFIAAILTSLGRAVQAN